MFGRKFYGTITLSKSIGDKVRIISWRYPHSKTIYWANSGDLIPYHLATYLMLMPRVNDPVKFDNVIYQFTHKDLDELEVNKEQLKIQRRDNQTKILLDLRNC